MPPGQHVTRDFPVLSAGPTPHTPAGEWTFSIRAGGGTLKSWTWQEFRALPAETVTVDIHCVTSWSKLGTVWRGVAVRTLLDQVEHDAPYVLAFCDGGYTTNLPAGEYEVCVNPVGFVSAVPGTQLIHGFICSPATVGSAPQAVTFRVVPKTTQAAQ